MAGSWCWWLFFFYKENHIKKSIENMFFSSFWQDLGKWLVQLCLWVKTFLSLFLPAKNVLFGCLPFFSKTIQFLVLSMVFSGGLVLQKYWFSNCFYCCLYWTTELVPVAAFFLFKRLL